MTQKTEADYRDEKWTECNQCGWIGGLWELKEHPTRSNPMDLGFCPECGCECEDVFGTAEKDRRIAEYDA